MRPNDRAVVAAPKCPIPETLVSAAASYISDHLREKQQNYLTFSKSHAQSFEIKN